MKINDLSASNLLLTHIVPFQVPWHSIEIKSALIGDLVI
jgi:hypothetical protein